VNNKPKYTALTPEEQRIWRMGYDKHDSELRPEPTAGDVEGDLLWAANIIAQITPEWDRLIASRTMEKVEGAHQELDAWSNIKYIIADALSAARGNRAELEAAAREAVAEACEFCRYGKKELPGRRDYCKSEHCQWLKIIDALAALVKAEEVENGG